MNITVYLGANEGNDPALKTSLCQHAQHGPYFEWFVGRGRT